MIAGFETDVDAGPLGAIAGLSQGEDFGVRLPGPRMEAFANDGPLLHDDGPDHGVRGGLSLGPTGKGETTLHHGAIEGTGHGGEGTGNREQKKT